jgi:hypothetical protein
MLKTPKFFFIFAISMIFAGCEPTVNTQQITQSAQNLRENVRNIDTQRITQGAQNLKKNLQNLRTTPSTNNQNTDPASESLATTDPILAGILGDVLEEDSVTTTEITQEIAELDTTRLSDENDFEAVSERQSIESDAERIENNRALYVLVEPKSIPMRPGSNVPSIVEYAIKTTNPVGTQLYSRPFASKTRFDWNCAKYSSQSAAQEAFLVWGGPKVDPRGIDPDGDGFRMLLGPQAFQKLY